MIDHGLAMVLTQGDNILEVPADLVNYLYIVSFTL